MGDYLHTQVTADYMGNPIMVDRQMLPLLSILWDNQIRTYNSCQDNNGMIWIEFKRIHDLQTIIRKSYIKNTCIDIKHEFGTGMSLYEFFIRRCKKTMTIHDNGHLDEDDDYWIGGDDLDFSISLRFEKEYLIPFTEALKKIFQLNKL